MITMIKSILSAFLLFGLVLSVHATTQQAALNQCNALAASYASGYVSGGITTSCHASVQSGCVLGLHAATPFGPGSCTVAKCYNGYAGVVNAAYGCNYQVPKFNYSFDTYSCTPGETHSGNWPGLYNSSSSKCVQQGTGIGCLFTFSPTAADGTGDTSSTANINISSVVTTSGTWTGTGQVCTPDHPPPEICQGDGSDSTKCASLPPNPSPPEYCDQNSGLCVPAHPQPPSGPPTICMGDLCVPPPPIGGPGDCATGGNSALCAGPGAAGDGSGGGGGPQPPQPPLPPNPPIDPDSPQPPPVIVVTNPPSGGGSGPQSNNYQGSSCGGTTGIACGGGGGGSSTQGSGSGGGSSGGGSGGGSGTGSGGGGSGGPDANGCENGWCPASCPAGQTLQGSTCSGGGSPACSDNTAPNSDGLCRPPQCGAGYVLAVNGSCAQVHCDAGFSLGNDGTCHRVPTCSTGQTMGANGQCYQPPACATGYTLQPDGTCKANAAGGGTGDPPTCPAGTVLSGGSCVSPPTGGGGGGGGGSGGGSTPPGTCTAGEVCNDSASGGYDCNAAPSCAGDTVLCNIDFQAWHAQCPGHMPNHGADADYLAGRLQAGASGTWTDEDDSDLSSKLDASGFLANSGACQVFDPIDVAFGGSTAHIDWSGGGWCLVSQAIGSLLLALAYFRAFQIISRG